MVLPNDIDLCFYCFFACTCAVLIQAFRVEAKLDGQALPGHFDGLLLEVVPKRPVAEHLEVGVVVHVFAHVVQVVVLAPCPDALLRVDRRFHPVPEEEGGGDIRTPRNVQQQNIIIAQKQCDE